MFVQGQWRDLRTDQTRLEEITIITLQSNIGFSSTQRATSNECPKDDQPSNRPIPSLRSSRDILVGIARAREKRTQRCPAGIESTLSQCDIPET